MKSPIILSAIVSIPANATRELEVSELRNPFNTAMLLDEIRLEVDALAVGLSDFSSVNDIKARFRLGRMHLTADFVPCTMLGRSLNPIGCLAGTLDVPGEEMFTWRLPKPLYVPANEFVVPILLNAPDGSSATRSVRVTYAGRSLGRSDPVPEIVNLPWVASFRAVQARPDSGAADLVNPFEQPLYVQRLIGRGYDTNGSELIDSSDVSVRITDSLGRHSVRDPTPFPHLFDRSTRAWEARCVLPPKHYFLTSFTGGLGTDIYYVSVVGHRQVRMST